MLTAVSKLVQRNTLSSWGFQRESISLPLSCVCCNELVRFFCYSHREGGFSSPQFVKRTQICFSFLCIRAHSPLIMPISEQLKHHIVQVFFVLTAFRRGLFLPLFLPFRNEAVFRTFHISSESLSKEKEGRLQTSAGTVRVVCIQSEQRRRSWQQCG